MVYPQKMCKIFLKSNAFNKSLFFPKKHVYENFGACFKRHKTTYCSE